METLPFTLGGDLRSPGSSLPVKNLTDFKRQENSYFPWTWRDSNPRPLRCERNDLPLIYKPECGSNVLCLWIIVVADQFFADDVVRGIGKNCCKKRESENNLDIEFLGKFLVSVPDGDLGDPRHFCHFPLGPPLPAEDR